MSRATELEDAFVLPTYEKFPFALARGEGCWVYDESGRRYLDLYGGHAVCLLGHSPREVAEAVSRQARELLFYSNLAYAPRRGEAARALVELCGEPGAKVFFCNSGAEANEAAMRLARAATARPVIVATEGSFHGRTAGALAATGLAKYRKNARGLGADVRHVPFGDLAAAEAALDGSAAGFLLEPIQSMAGVVPPPPGYLEGLAELCRKAGALLIFDEVQTGLGRLGAPSAARAYGVRPDLSTFAKGLGSGVPAGALLASPAVSRLVKHGDLGSTFGGGPLACAAVEATLKAVSERRLWENAARREEQLRSLLRFPRVREVRGRGLLLGIVLDGPSKPVRAALLEDGILVGGAEDPAVIRLLPPLTLSAEEAALFAEALGRALSATAAGAPA